MRKLFVIFAVVASIASYAAATHQYFYACNKLWKIDANASEAEVLYWMDKIEAECNQ